MSHLPLSAHCMLLAPLLLALGAAQDPEPAWKSRSVPDSDLEIRPALVGTKVPAAKVRELDGTPLPLAKIFEEGPTILIFYRGGW